MSSLVAVASVSLNISKFAPIAVGFFGLGVGYLIYGPQELFQLPGRDRRVDISTGIWGIWMPGFMQFLTGVYLFVGLSWFSSFRDPLLYMAALAFTAYGVHWWAIGLGRALGSDPRPNAFMSVGFLLISILGIVVFFKGHDAPVGGLFIGLTCIYAADFFASFFVTPVRPPHADPEARTAAPAAASRHPLGEFGERALGFFHIGTGLWLMYLTWATALNFANGFTLPL